MPVWSWCKFGATLYRASIKRSESASLLVSERVQIALRAFCEKQNRVRSTTSVDVKLARSIISTFGRISKSTSHMRSAFCYLLDELRCSYDCPSGKLWVMIGYAKLWATMSRWGEAGNHIITFAKGKIITLAKQAHNSKLFSAVLFTFCRFYGII